MEREGSATNSQRSPPRRNSSGQGEMQGVPRVCNPIAGQMYLHVLEGKFDGACEARCVKKNVIRELDEALWSQLSNDLIRRILLWLPPTSQSRFRAVCKIWYEMLASDVFQRDTATLQSVQSLPICGYVYSRPSSNIPNGISNAELEQHDNWRLENLQIRKKCQLDLSFIPSWIGVESIVKTTRDGLLCTAFSLSSSACGAGWCIINPFTRTWREVPPIPNMVPGREWSCAEEVRVDKTSPSHIVAFVILEHMGRKWSICRYSSKNNDWRVTPGLSGSFLPYRGQRPPARILNYVFTSQLIYTRLDDGRLLLHSLEDGNLTRGNPGQHLLDMPFCEPYTEFDMVEHEGRIFACWLWRAGHTERSANPSMPIFGISELNNADLRWRDSVCLPEGIMISAIRELTGRRMPDGSHITSWWEASRNFSSEVTALGEYICVKLINYRTGPQCAAQYVVRYHIASQTWKNLESYVPHTSGSRASDVELFTPRCLQVYL